LVKIGVRGELATVSYPAAPTERNRLQWSLRERDTARGGLLRADTGSLDAGLGHCLKTLYFAQRQA
jgi:hypothetical protein